MPIISRVTALTPGNARRPGSNVPLAYLLAPETYTYLGVDQGSDTLRVRLRDRNGRRRDVTLAPEPISLMQAYESGSVVGWGAPEGWTSIIDLAPTIPQSYRRRGEMAWFEPLPDRNALLVQINQPRPDEADTMRSFVSSLYDHLIEHRYERIVVDLRGNEGGWYTLTNALAGVFASFAFEESSPKLFVLIGPDTTSAGVVLATQFEMQTNAVFVGEGTGSSPNFYGAYRAQQLPNSGIYFRVSRQQQVISLPEDDRVRLQPDVASPERLDQFLRGIDGALEAALSYSASDDETPWFARWRRPSQH